MKQLLLALLLLSSVFTGFASASHLSTASNSGITYLTVPTPRESWPQHEYAYCNNWYNDRYDSRYYSHDYSDCSFDNHRHSYYHSSEYGINYYGRSIYTKPLPPGLSLKGWRYQYGKYVRDYYEGYR